MKIEIDVTGVVNEDPEFEKKMSGLKVVKLAIDVSTRSGIILVVPMEEHHMSSDKTMLMYLLADYMGRWLLDQTTPIQRPSDHSERLN